MQCSTFPLSILVPPLKAEAFIPLFSLTVELSMHKLSKEALLFSDHCSLSMRQAILEESIVVESIREKLAITLALKVDNFPPVEGSIRHWRKLILLDILSIIISQSLYLLAESSAL